MSNAETLRLALERFSLTEPPLDLYADDLVFVTREELTGRVEFHGHDGFRRALGEYSESWADARPELLGTEVIADDVLVAGIRWHVRGHSGIELSVDESWAVWMRDGLIARTHQFGSREEALAACR